MKKGQKKVVYGDQARTALVEYKTEGYKQCLLILQLLLKMNDMMHMPYISHPLKSIEAQLIGKQIGSPQEFELAIKRVIDQAQNQVLNNQREFRMVMAVRSKFEQYFQEVNKEDRLFAFANQNISPDEIEQMRQLQMHKSNKMTEEVRHVPQPRIHHRKPQTPQPMH